MCLAKDQILAGLLDDAEVTLNSVDGQERNFWWHFWQSLDCSSRGMDNDVLNEVNIAIRLRSDEMTVFFSVKVSFYLGAEIGHASVTCRRFSLGGDNS
jgi:hypothetical protein